LRGTSWERVEDQAEKLGQVQRRIATESDHNGSVASSCVRVLSIDGGGIRGIIPAMFLAELKRRTNQPIAKLFDYIVGTSTGGIIALGLAAPDAKHPDQPLHKADELIALYTKEGSRIFPRRPLQGLLGLLWPKYRADDIEKILKDYFGDLLLGDALTKVVIPTYLLEGKGVKSHFFLDSYSDSAVFIYMREAARATSAAPTYFPPYQIPWLTGPVALIDGGVFANNPAPYALSIVKRNERRDFLERYPLLMVSLGTGKLPHTNQFKQAWRWGDIGWIKPILDITLSDPGVEDEAHDLMNFSDLYFRFQPTLDDLTAELDNATDANIAALTKIAETSIQENKTALDKLVTQLKRGRPRGCQRTGL
jgi:hypothetical protein